VQRFSGGHGRRPGATVVAVQLRQQVLDVLGGYVSASTSEHLALIHGDEVEVRVQVRNASIYDVGAVEMKHRYTAAKNGPKYDGVATVKGAVYDPTKRTFTINHIPSNETVEFTFRTLLRGSLTYGISQTKMELMDFVVLESNRRFPPRTPESTLEQHRQRVERVGIGGTEVSCFTGEFGEPDLPVEPPVGGPPPITRTAGALPIGDIIGNVTVTKRPSTIETLPGSRGSFSIYVQNKSPYDLHDLTVTDNFDTQALTVVDTGGGTPTTSGLVWQIASLPAENQWTTRYAVEVKGDDPGNRVIASTVILNSQELIDVPRNYLSASSELHILGGGIMPQTGVDTSLILIAALQILIGTLIAFSIFGLGFREVWRRIE
jgi:hypothetical protein